MNNQYSFRTGAYCQRQLRVFVDSHDMRVMTKIEEQGYDLRLLMLDFLVSSQCRLPLSLKLIHHGRNLFYGVLNIG